LLKDRQPQEIFSIGSAVSYNYQNKALRRGVGARRREAGQVGMKVYWSNRLS
jgi:hypothetical protein